MGCVISKDVSAQQGFAAALFNELSHFEGYHPRQVFNPISHELCSFLHNRRSGRKAFSTPGQKCLLSACESCLDLRVVMFLEALNQLSVCWINLRVSNIDFLLF